MACRFTPNPQQLIEHKHLGTTLRKAVAKAESGEGASVFGYYVDDPERLYFVKSVFRV